MARIIPRRGSGLAKRASEPMFEENSLPREITTEGILAGMAQVHSLFSEDYENLIKKSALMVRDSDEQAG